LFRTRKNFLGTSRMSIRTELLKRIVPVPEALVISGGRIPLYAGGSPLSSGRLVGAADLLRHHGSNSFIISADDPAKVRSNSWFFKRFPESSRTAPPAECGTENPETIVETIEIEARQLRLAVDGGWPWETVSTELRLMRILHSDASIWQHLFSCARLIPALATPPRTYYRWRRDYSRLLFIYE